MDNEVLSLRNGHALVVTFNRPEQQNAMTLDMANQVFTILKNTTTDRSVRAVMLNGAGKNFMSGLDMSIYKGDVGKALEQSNQLYSPYHSSIRELQAMDKPVLASVEGVVAGSGFSFMLACDLVIAARSTRFCARFAEYGLSPDGGCTFFLPRKVGTTKALELLMLGREFGAEEALQVGLVNFVVEDFDLEHESMSLITKLASGPTKSLGGIKKMILRAYDQDMNVHLGLEHTYAGQCSRSFDFREYLRAAASGRDVSFTGT